MSGESSEEKKGERGERGKGEREKRKREESEERSCNELTFMPYVFPNTLVLWGSNAINLTKFT